MIEFFVTEYKEKIDDKNFHRFLCTLFFLDEKYFLAPGYPSGVYMDQTHVAYGMSRATPTPNYAATSQMTQNSATAIVTQDPNVAKYPPVQSYADQALCCLFTGP